MKTEQASSTAKVIAASTLLLAADSRNSSLIPPGAAELCRLFLSTCASDRWFARSAQMPMLRGAWRLMEKATHPGIIEHYWHRKRWIEQRVRLAISSGLQRLIVLGAGFDTLGCRLAVEFSQLQVIELDHPATQAVKHRALTGMAESDVCLPELLPLDLLGNDLPPALLDSAQSTLVIAEGLLMYLSDSAIDQLFARLQQFQSCSLQLIFSYMSRWPDQSMGFRPRSWLIDRWLKWRGEPFTWALADDQVDEFLRRRGAVLRERALTADFSPPRQKLRGENLVWAVLR